MTGEPNRTPTFFWKCAGLKLVFKGPLAGRQNVDIFYFIEDRFAQKFVLLRINIPRIDAARQRF